MLSWMLYQRLRKPVAHHPVFRYMQMTRRNPSLTWLWPAGVALVSLLIVVQPGLFVALVVLTPILYGAFNVSINALAWSASVAETLSRLRRRRQYALLSITPDGPMTVNWVILSERLHYRDGLRNSVSDMRSTSVVLFMFMGFVLLGAMVEARPDARMSLVALAFMLLALNGGLVLDYFQSLASSSLIALWVGDLTTQESDARLWASAAFLTVQVLFYITMISSVVGVGLLFGRMDSVPVVARFLAPAALLSTYAGLRELVVWLLWRKVNRQLNGDESLEQLSPPLHRG